MTHKININRHRHTHFGSGLHHHDEFSSRGSDLPGIPVHDLKSNKVIFSLRFPVNFFLADVKGQSLIPCFESRAVAKLDYPPITKINVIPVTNAPDLLLRNRSCASLSLETTQLVYPLLTCLAKVPQQHLVTPG